MYHNTNAIRESKSGLLVFFQFGKNLILWKEKVVGLIQFVINHGLIINKHKGRKEARQNMSPTKYFAIFKKNEKWISLG